MENGTFVISLDFELYWGVRDVISLEKYKENLAGVREFVPSLMALFEKYDIVATFATVGFLFYNNKAELLRELPVLKPEYSNQNLSPYISHIASIGENETEDIYHYAPSLINLILSYKHEIGTHTFSHYYCLEHGQSTKQFRDDLKAAKNVADKRGIKLTSIIFPRHQFSEPYLKVCYEEGILCYRGNQRSWIHKPVVNEEKAYFRRFFRMLDTYINILGHNTFTDSYMTRGILTDVPASRFLRPYSRNLRVLDKLRLRRIYSDMNFAAEKNQLYHLWWHPHNFGINLRENMEFLEEILKHFKTLNAKFGFESLTMEQITTRLQKQKT